jgi:hypothetical protein
MTLEQIQARTRELNRHLRADDLLAAEAIAIELSDVLEPIFDDLDNRGLILSWGIDS